MKKFFITLMVLFFSAALFAAPPLKEIVIFGDSLSDDGNLYQYLKIIPKSPPYYKGRFSNGPTWAEHVGDYFYSKWYIPSTNYAYGGATAILHHLRTDPFIAPTLLEVEVDSYLKNNRLKDKSTTLFGIWIGANDYLYDTVPDIERLTDQVVAKITDSIKTLIGKGGKYFLVMNLPDLSKTPYSRENNLSERLAALSVMHNNKLKIAVNNLKKEHPNVKFIDFDIYSLFIDILTYPDKYNEKYGTHIIDTTNACWTGPMVGSKKSVDQALLNSELNNDRSTALIIGSPALSYVYALGKKPDLEPCPNADEFLFWDDLHPTAIIHQVLGRIMVDAILQ